jgi:hypothetical protein
MIYAQTESGVAAVKDRRAVELTRGQRYALLLFDGQRSIEAVLSATAVLGVTKADLKKLLSLGLITLVSSAPAQPLADSMLAPLQEKLDEQERARRYRTAYPLAVEITSELGLKGIKLNMAVERARGFEDLVKLMPRLRDAVGREVLIPLRAVLEGR